MNTRRIVLLPTVKKILEEMGANVKLARLRRKLSAEQVADRAKISRQNVWRVEKGSPAVSMATYAQILFVLGLEKDLLKVAADDVLGRRLQDADIMIKERAPKRKPE